MHDEVDELYNGTYGDKDGLPVMKCIRGSAADRAGIQVGDIIVEVNGKPVTNASTYVAARGLEHDLMHVIVRREAKLMRMTLHFASFTQHFQRPNLTLN